jgi:signal transduction histidine kinase
MDAVNVEPVDAKLPLLVRWARHRYTARQLLAADVVFVLGVGATTALVVKQEPTVTGTGWDAVLWAAGVVASVAVLFRRHYPRATLAATAALSVLFLATGLILPTELYLILAIYSFVTVSDRAESLVAITFIAVVEGAVVIAAGGGHDLATGTETVNQMSLAGVAWFAGESAKNARQYSQARRERLAEREAAAEIERTAEIRGAVNEERATIARELHDVVAHAMSIVTVRAGVARMLIDTRPEEARAALEIIEATSRRSLQEMRLLVGVLRRDEERAADLAPAPGLSDLPQLVADIAAAGVATDVRLEGTPHPLAPSADLTAYRIVQEALTNVVRHAGTTNADVVIDYRADEIVIEVTDEGPRGGIPPVEPPSGGHGLIGMRERAALFGGTLESGPRGPGFRVKATLSRRDADPVDLGVPGRGR